MQYLFFSCSVCFGDPNSSFSKGVLAGVFFLMAVVGGVLGSIAWTSFVWARRAKKLEDNKTHAS